MLSLLIIVLIAAIVFFQAVHGLFSSLIMALCTLVCTLVAFAFYEPLASLAGLYQTQPAYGEAIMLVALLVVPLFVLRFLVDSYLTGNIVPGMWVDRIGGAAFGLVTALLLVGTLVIAMQMLPFERSILGWDPYDANLAEADGLIVDAPAFTRGVVGTLSAGSLGGKPFGDVHEDLRLELWAVRNRDAGARTDAEPGGVKLLSVTDVTDVPMVDDETDRTTFASGAPAYPGVNKLDSRVYIVRIQATEGALDRDRKWRLRGTHLRLVTDSGESYFPVGYLVYAGRWQVLSAPIGDVQITREHASNAKTLTADLLFRVPLTGAKAPKLSHLTFRRSVDMPVRDVLAAETHEQMPDYTAALACKEVYGEVPVSGRTTMSLFIPERAVVNAASPVEATYPIVDMQRSGNGPVSIREGGAIVDVKLVEYDIQVGSIRGPAAKLNELHGNTTRYMVIENLHVPAGMRVVRLEGRPRNNRTLLNATVSLQARIHLTSGEPLPMVGAWVKWTEGNVEQTYLYYNSQRLDDPNLYLEAFPEDDAVKALDLYRDHLGSVTDVGLLFLAPEDATVVGFNLAGNQRFNCESPMAVQRPRRRYR